MVIRSVDNFSSATVIYFGHANLFTILTVRGRQEDRSFLLKNADVSVNILFFAERS